MRRGVVIDTSIRSFVLRPFSSFIPLYQSTIKSLERWTGEANFPQSGANVLTNEPGRINERNEGRPKISRYGETTLLRHGSSRSFVRLSVRLFVRAHMARNRPTSICFCVFRVFRGFSWVFLVFLVFCVFFCFFFSFFVFLCFFVYCVFLFLFSVFVFLFFVFCFCFLFFVSVFLFLFFVFCFFFFLAPSCMSLVELGLGLVWLGTPTLICRFGETERV